VNLDLSSVQVQIHLAIIKGVIESDDSKRHFGSLGAHEHYCSEVVELGWARRIMAKHPTEGFELEKLEITAEGRRAYEASGVSAFEAREGFRWMFWPWPQAQTVQKKPTRRRATERKSV
jgi:hypothetical protein